MKKLIFSILAFTLLLLEIGAQGTNFTVADFKQKISSTGNPQILDARSPEEFALNHIKGAVNINLQDSSYLIQISRLNPEIPTFVYSINNGRSSILAKKLREKGFKDVNDLPGGLANWVGSGYPLESFGKKGLVIPVESFHQLLKSSDLVLVDFGSKFCGGCRKLAPVVDSLENHNIQNLKVVRVELYDNPQLLKDQQINSLPTLVLFQNGSPVWRNKGFIAYKELLAAVEKKRGDTTASLESTKQ